MAFWHDYLKWEIFEFPGGQTQNWRTMGHWLEEESHTISETKFFRQEEIPNPVGWWSIVGETMCQSWDEAWWCVCAPWMASTFWTAEPTGECLVKGMHQHCTSIAHSLCAPYRFLLALDPNKLSVAFLQWVMDHAHLLVLSLQLFLMVVLWQTIFLQTADQFKAQQLHIGLWSLCTLLDKWLHVESMHAFKT